MENITDVFWYFLDRARALGGLKKINYYGEDFATIKIEKDGKEYTFSMRCEEKTDGNS